VKLALEAETAITQLLILDHEYYRKQVADSIETPHAPDEPIPDPILHLSDLKM